MFNSLPPDNFPDDYESRAYQRYHPAFKPGMLHWLRYEAPRLMLALVPLSIVGTAFILTLVFLPAPAPRVVVITVEPIANLQTPMPAEFPVPATQQQVITLPARVDHDLPFAEKHAYRFWLEPGLTWTFSVITIEGMMPVISLYNPQGLIISQQQSTAPSVSMSYTPTEEGQYALIVETAGGGATAGGYTLRIMPEQ